ncbi:MAG: TRAP transporter small permease, partial [Lachnospiraceae bacterium]|nr:TRAP transporter small permease [Lachnospiraceae bacterium]
VMVIAVVDIIMAKIFQAALPSATEWITYLNVLIVYPALAYVQLARGHTRVDMFDKIFPPIVKKIIRILSFILAVAVMAFLTWRGACLTITKLATHESSSMDASAIFAFQIWVFSAIYTIGCGLCTLSFVWSILREFMGLSIFEKKIEEKKEDKFSGFKGGEEE